MTTDGRRELPALPPRQGGTEGGTGAPVSAAPGTCTGAGSVPPSVPPVALVPVTAPERAVAAARRGGTAALEAVRELWLHPDRLLYVMWHGKPESMAEHRAYMKSRAWVPPGMDGKPEKAAIGVGLFYHLIIGRPLLAVANTFGAAAVRPLRLLCLIAFVVLLVLLLPL